MPRRLKVGTTEMGPLELYLIYEVNGEWEEEWRPLQGTWMASVMTVATKETVDHCLRGWSKPLFQVLGLPPWGVLRKFPEEAKECALRKGCTFYNPKDCSPTAKKMPWCYEPDGLSDNEEIRRLGAELIKLWREGVYVILVQEVADVR